MAEFSCKTQAEQKKAELKWEKVDLEFFVPDEIKDALDEYSSTSDTVQEYLDLAQQLLEAAKLFLLGQVNTALLALALILQQVKKFINEIRNTGVYAMYIIPEEGTGTFLSYEDIIPGYKKQVTAPRKPLEGTFNLNTDEQEYNPFDELYAYPDKSVKNPVDGIYTLDTETLFDHFINSFTDTADGDRPPFDENSFAGGAVIFAGSSGNILEIIQKFTRISKLFAILFDAKVYKDFYESMKKVYETNVKTPFNPEYGYGDGAPPNWQAIRPVRDFFKRNISTLDGGVVRSGVLDTVFIRLLAYIEGLENQVKAAMAIVELQVKFIEQKLKQIQELKNLIDEIAEFAKDVRDGVDALKTAEVAALVVNPKVGGLTDLKKAVKDETLENRPLSSHTFTTMISLVGGGTGIMLVLYLLGLSDELDWGVGDTSNLEEEQLKKDFGLLGPDTFTFPPTIPSPPDLFSLDDYLPDIGKIISSLLP